MRVGLITWGTEGDVRPFVSLARALRDRGHAVRLVYVGVEGRDFDALARAHGVEVEPIGLEYFRAHRDALQRNARESLRRGNPAEQFELILRDLMDPIADALLARSLEVARQSDVVAGHVLAHPVATAAEVAGAPYAAVALQPLFRSRHYPPAGAPDLGRYGNPWLWRLADHIMRRALDARIQRQRASLGVSRASPFDASAVGAGRCALLAVSPTLFPRPDDWHASITSTGFLSLPVTTSWSPPDALREFLAAGPPVYAGFGSMSSLDEASAREAVAVLCEATSRAGVRAVIQCPPSARVDVGARADVRFIEHAPHDALFAACSVVVHHGGAGTTQSALRAGRASVVVPHAADQFYWGDMLHARGVAAKPLPRTRLAAKPLAARIRWALDRPALTERAGALATTLAVEDGPVATALALERFAASPT